MKYFLYTKCVKIIRANRKVHLHRVIRLFLEWLFNNGYDEQFKTLSKENLAGILRSFNPSAGEKNDDDSEGKPHDKQWWIQDFPLGGHRAVGGLMRLWCRCFSVKTHVKMKELDPVEGGACQQHPLDPPMQNSQISHQSSPSTSTVQQNLGSRKRLRLQGSKLSI